MAIFNPSPNPTQAPDFSGLSKPTSGGVADTSTGMALKTTGDALTGIVNIADQWIKGDLKKQAETGVDTLKDAYTQYLVNANAGVNTDANGNIVVPPTAVAPAPQGPNKDGSSLDLLPENTPNAPVGVQNGLERYGRIAEAQSQNSGSKANDTSYTAQLTALAKNLRAQWPGYRDYIDEQISSISGIPIANAYVKNLLQDLNAAQTAAKASSAKIESALLSQVTDKVPGAAAAYLAYQKSGDVATALNFVETAKSVKQRADEASSALSLEKAQGDNINVKAKANLDLIFSNEMNLAWKGAAQGAGIKSPEDWTTVIDNAAQGGVMPNSVEQRQAATALAGQRAQLEARWRAKASEVMEIRNSDGSTTKQSYSSLVGAEAVNGIIKEKLKSFDTYIDAVTNDKTGTAVYAANHTKAYSDDLENRIATNPTNIAMEITGIVSRRTSPQFASTVLGEAMAKNIDQTVRNLYTDKTMEMLSQPNLNTKGVPTTFKQIVQDAKSPNATKDGPIKPDTKFFDNILDNVNILARGDSPLQAKEDIARTFFDPMNRGVLTEFKEDSKDAQGRTIGGRETIFNILTAPKITKGVAEVAKVNPQIGINYKNFVETEWGTAIMGPRLNKLKDVLDGTASNQVSIPGGIHVAFDDGKTSGQPKIVLIDKNGKPLERAGKTDIEVNYFNNIKENVAKINQGMGNILEVNKAFNGNMAVSVLSAMQNAGIDIPNNKVGQAILKSAPNKALDELENNNGVNLRRKPTLPETN